MADETSQAEEETSWWVFDAFADSELPSTSFDEPLEWPEALDWGDVGGSDAELRFPGSYDDGSYDLSDPIFPSAAEVEPFGGPAPTAVTPPAPAGDVDEPTMAVTPLAALGGAAPGVRPATGRTVHERLPDSIWAADRQVAGVTGALGGATTITTELDGGHDRAGGWRRRLDFRHGNAAVIALISFVSLVLLGMFLSVRARNDVPTDSSQTRTTSDRIAVQGTLNTVPATIPTTLAGPPSTINIADLVPAAEDATSAGGATAPTAGSGSGGATGTTAAPRPASGGSTATTQPAAQPTNTTAAQPPVETTTPTTAAQPPVDSTTVTTRRTTPTTPTSLPDITWPTIPGGSGNPPFTFPSIPGRD